MLVPFSLAFLIDRISPPPVSAADRGDITTAFLAEADTRLFGSVITLILPLMCYFFVHFFKTWLRR